MCIIPGVSFQNVELIHSTVLRKSSEGCSKALIMDFVASGLLPPSKHLGLQFSKDGCNTLSTYTHHSIYLVMHNALLTSLHWMFTNVGSLQSISGSRMRAASGKDVSLRALGAFVSVQ
jgi:hypothetical protein